MAAASAKSTAPRRRFKLVPRVLEPRVGQLRRDLRVVLANLRGERAPAWLARDGSRYAGAPAGLATRELEISEVIRETADAVSLVLRDPSGASLPPIRPGQFFTLLVELDGETLRRAYSVSSDCSIRDRFSVTIKRVPDGRVSTYLNDHAAPGMRLRALGPSGEFAREPARKLVLIAGGSGVTPMMALLRTLLTREPQRELALIYANRSQADVIFADALARLAVEHGPRLAVLHALEQPPPSWSGAVGRCTGPTLAGMLDDTPLASDPDSEFLLCGPTPMMDGARELLGARGVAAARIHSESFLAPQLQAKAAAKVRAPQAVTIVTAQREVGVVVQPGQTLLEAGLAAGLDMPYSCAMGGCAACKVELERGEVIMREPNCLGPTEREAGQVLACVACPSAPCRVRVRERGEA
ncbi:3-ketosteroid-9-alpha-hydroxylase reductase subunit [Enhygromyxa salina]|uniref:3-ketosteroid-9-alpha-hydroxylase reductase subunit n=1 Tax=Enhygromyxa salina TaxID=215803 RepID=A0A2S9XDV1_9BACT|nr:ferredoxin--NADP reductase [Enhygromyxa salina]PRP91048.1 3-ketosteroid-9-alpha-hydroxylase reductase subunit [Enhygromyxa salina]